VRPRSHFITHPDAKASPLSRGEFAVVSYRTPHYLDLYMIKKLLSAIRFVLHKLALFWSIILLTVIYFIGMGFAFILLLIARKSIVKSFRKQRESYWVDKQMANDSLSSARKS